MRVLLKGFFAGCLLLVLAGSAGAQATKVTLDSLVGDWLNRDYVEALNKTKSPLASLTSRYSHMTFYKRGQSYGWVVVQGFDSVERANMIDGLKPTGEPGTYAFIYSPVQRESTGIGNDRIVYPDGSPDTIAWIGDGRVRFVRVRPSMELYVNHVVLAGDYTDAKGRKFRFTDDCRAEWPDTTFTYRIGLGYALVRCDYLWIPAEKNRPLAFEWKDGKLLVYDVIRPTPGFEAMHPSGAPLHVLTPVKK
jgi:hypothetical protein